jgi:hypothetical protein
VFTALADGAAPPDGVIAIDAPDDRHVIDYVRSEWLPARAARSEPTPARRAPVPARV